MFFEGFNYAVICEKINKRYPTKNQWLDYGAITCAIICLLFHPFSTSFWGIVEIVTTLIAIYGMLIVKKEQGMHGGVYLPFALFGMPSKLQRYMKSMASLLNDFSNNWTRDRKLNNLQKVANFN